jgi:hypothetical protein
VNDREVDENPAEPSECDDLVLLTVDRVEVCEGVVKDKSTEHGVELSHFRHTDLSIGRNNFMALFVGIKVVKFFLYQVWYKYLIIDLWMVKALVYSSLLPSSSLEPLGWGTRKAIYASVKVRWEVKRMEFQRTSARNSAISKRGSRPR